MADKVSPTTKVPPRTPEYQVQAKDVSNPNLDLGAEICPAHEVCKSVNNFYPGTCTKNPTADAKQRCEVSMVLLLGKLLKK